MKRKNYLTGMAVMIGLFGAHEWTQASESGHAIRVSAIFDALPHSVNRSVTFTLPDGTQATKSISAKERIALSDAFAGVEVSSQFKYKIKSNYGGVKEDSEGNPAYYDFEDEGTCRNPITLEDRGRKLEAVQLAFTLLPGKNPRQDNGPWYRCEIKEKFAQ